MLHRNDVHTRREGVCRDEAAFRKRLQRALRELWFDLLALVWPTQCVVCAAADRDLCDACRGEVRADRGSYFRVRAPVGLDYLAGGPYDGALRALLVGLKHDGRTGFARELGGRLEGPLSAAIAACESARSILLISAPSRRAKVRERGYRHVDLITREALRLRARRTGGVARANRAVSQHTENLRAPPKPRLVAGVLIASRGRTGQVGLSSDERLRNAERVRVSRLWRSALRGAQVIVIDDIVTTGATVAAAREALIAAGAEVLAIVALCTVARRDSGAPPPPSLAHEN